MYYLVYIVIIIMSVRCISYGASVLGERNIAGGIAVILLAAGAMYCGLFVFI